jgi:predicted NBD/HSP70 family sugar kinase
MSRQELAEETGLSAGTVTTVIGRLIEQGLITEAGTEDSEGGRPRILLEVAADRGLAIGIEVGETRVRVEAFDLALQKVGAADRAVAPGYRDPEGMVDLIAEALGEVLRGVDSDPSAIWGIGVGVSGIVDQGANPLVHAASFGWHDVPLAAMLRSRFDVPVIVDNGAKALGQAEMWRGAGRGARHAVVALLGTGVGAAVFTDGNLYRGSHSSAGEWGHAPIMVGGRACRCGSRGCLEAYVGGLAIAEQWSVLRGEQAWNPGDQEAAIADVIASMGKLPQADQLVGEVATNLGAGFATLINLFNPERIILSGWIGLALGPVMLDQVRAQTKAYALQPPFEQVEIVLGELGPDAVALGAATLVVDQILAGGLPASAGGPRLGAGVRTRSGVGVRTRRPVATRPQLTR